MPGKNVASQFLNIHCVINNIYSVSIQTGLSAKNEFILVQSDR